MRSRSAGPPRTRRSPRPPRPSPDCCAPEPASGNHATAPADAKSARRRTPGTPTYRVSGMTCAHCADAGTREVSDVAGVDSVEVSVESGTVVMTGEDDVRKLNRLTGVS